MGVLILVPILFKESQINAVSLLSCYETSALEVGDILVDTNNQEKFLTVEILDYCLYRWHASSSKIELISLYAHAVWDSVSEHCQQGTRMCR